MKSTRCPRFPWRVIAACGLAAVVTLTASGATAGPAPARTERRPIVAASGENTDSKPSFGSLPICFEPNVGQASAGVKFLTRGSNASLTATGAVLEGGGQPVTLEFVGASGTARASGITELPGRSNYLIGNDPSKWRANVPTYASIRIGQLYPGVDLVWYGKGRSLEYDLVVASGADPNSIAFELEGFPSPELEADGALVAGDVRLERPFAYQEIDGARQAVASRFVLREAGRVAFELGDYDRTLPLVIDPEIRYSYPVADAAKDFIVSGVTVDTTGAAYVVGSIAPAGTGLRDVYVAKINAEGTGLVYSTTIGGARFDIAYDVAVDSAGSAFVTGETTSSDFPTTAGAFQAAFASANSADPDAFVLKLSPAGDAPAYSTYLGGAKFDHGRDIVIDAPGNAYVTGTTTSTNFPTTEPEQAGNGGLADAFMTIVNPTGSARVSSTYLGGSGSENGEGIAIDPAGNVTIVGATFSTDFPVTPGALQPTFGGGLIDGFWAKYDATGQRVGSTYLGGSGDDVARAVAVDATGNSYLTGEAGAADFPLVDPIQSTMAGVRDAFVSRIDAGGTSLSFSTFYGGGQYETGNAVAVDGVGRVTVVGDTYSTDFPTVDPVQSTFGGGLSDAFVLQVEPGAAARGIGATVRSATFLGNERANFGNDGFVDSSGGVFAGFTSPDLSQNGQENDEGGVTHYDSGPPVPRPDLEVSEIDVGSLKIAGIERRAITVTVVSTTQCAGPEAPDATIELEIPEGIGFFLADEPFFAPPIEILESPAQTRSGKVIAKYAGSVPYDTDGTLVRLLVIVTVPSTPASTLFRIRASAKTSGMDCRSDNNSLMLDLDTTKESVMVGSKRLQLKRLEAVGGAPAIQLVNHLAGSSPGGGSEREAEDVVGYNVYTSTQPNVQPVPANFFTMVPPNQTGVDVSTTPAGSFFIVTTVTDDGESAPSNEVGGVLPDVTKLKVSASKIVAQGTGFDAGVRVVFAGLPFSTAAKLKGGNTKVVQKGALVTGQTIGSFSDQLLGQGGTVIILLVNGNGNAVAVEYTR